jgi:hypothetical protein
VEESDDWMHRPVSPPVMAGDSKTLVGPAPDLDLAKDPEPGLNLGNIEHQAPGNYEVDVDVLRILSEETFRPTKR